MTETELRYSGARADTAREKHGNYERLGNECVGHRSQQLLLNATRCLCGELAYYTRTNLPTDGRRAASAPVPCVPSRQAREVLTYPQVKPSRCALTTRCSTPRRGRV